MLSNNFSHSYGSTWWKKPKNIKWDYFSNENSISVYIDNDMNRAFLEKNNGKLKFLWLLESRQFDGGVFNNIKENLVLIVETFEQVWTHSDELIKLHPIFKWCPAYGTYIKNISVHPKTKKISMITSNKQITEQHKFRYNFAIQNSNKLDLFGRGFKEISKKEEGLCDYMFSVAIENDTYDTYFTEKILDCFATGTIPIYMGTLKICDFFNSKGILFLEKTNIDNLDEDYYYSNIEHIKDNFELVKEYDILDDWIYNKYLINY